MIDKNNRKEIRCSNGIDYVYEFLSDGWISIWEFIDGLPLIPVIQAKTIEKADEYICMREKVSFTMVRLGD